MFPVVGGRKIEHLHANIEALSITLSPAQIAFLEGVLPFDPGFPSTMIVSHFHPSAALLSNTLFFVSCFVIGATWSIG